MFKHEIEYKDFNGNERKEDFYFHLSLPEVTRLEAEIGTSLDKHIDELQKNKKIKDLLAFMEKIILNAYGQKTSDGKSFIKNKQLRDEFEYSQAYAELFEQLIMKPDLAKKFGESVADNGKARKNVVAPQVVTDKQ